MMGGLAKKLAAGRKKEQKRREKKKSKVSFKKKKKGWPFQFGKREKRVSLKVFFIVKKGRKKKEEVGLFFRSGKKVRKVAISVGNPKVHLLYAFFFWLISKVMLLKCIDVNDFFSLIKRFFFRVMIVVFAHMKIHP